MKYNFVHADCHAGNILVRIKSVPNELTSYLYACANQAKNYIISQVVKYGYKSEFLKRLSE
jgi:predicted unusual protein kinase regulating ubiquinone biosynthesis (AarF/ABC1/UbiB family)